MRQNWIHFISRFSKRTVCIIYYIKYERVSFILNQHNCSLWITVSEKKGWALSSLYCIRCVQLARDEYIFVLQQCVYVGYHRVCGRGTSDRCLTETRARAQPFFSPVFLFGTRLANRSLRRRRSLSYRWLGIIHHHQTNLLRTRSHVCATVIIV